jgi:Leu/Phe-tRNA-protein transferase
VIKSTAEQLADYLEDCAREQRDNEAAALLRRLDRVYQAAHEMVWARTHEQSKAAYSEMIDLIKGRMGD